METYVIKIAKVNNIPHINLITGPLVGVNVILLVLLSKKDKTVRGKIIQINFFQQIGAQC